MKTEICRAVALYADNYSDEFKPYAQQFALTIWSLLTKLTLSPSYDEVINLSLDLISNRFDCLACWYSNEISFDIGCKKSSLWNV